MKKNDLTDLTIEDMSSEGLGIGHASGMAVFVKDAVIGDRVRAKIVKVKKSYAYARLEAILTPGPDRVAPICPAARQCGGCQIQEMSYPAQLRLKERKVRENLIRIGGFDLPSGPDSPNTSADSAIFHPIIGMENPWHYRNKAQFPIGERKDGAIIAGFYAGRTHTIIDCHQCEIGIEENRIILETVISWMRSCGLRPYREGEASGVSPCREGETSGVSPCREGEASGVSPCREGEASGVSPCREGDKTGGIRHVMIRAGFSTGDLMVVIVATTPSLREEQKLVSMLRSQIGDMLSANTVAKSAVNTVSKSAANTVAKSETDTGSRLRETQEPRRFHLRSILLNVNPARTNVILGPQTRVLYGDDFIEDRVGPLTYRISARSFYQVNPVQTAVLYQTALEYAALTGRENVWDLYCGTGTISLFLAQHARHVTGIEVIPEAVENAKKNAERNHIRNCTFVAGKAEDLVDALPRADVIVVDPPRKGLDRVVIDVILRSAPDRIVYVSCDSATLARDLKILCDGGFQLRHIQPVDQFCHTVHVESVVKLTRAGS